MQAIILAAGMGKRLREYTKDCTKCMVSVGNKKLIDRTIEALKQANIHRLIMVIGYEADKLEKYLRETVSDMELVFIYNKDYAHTNNIYSLYLAREELVKDDTILLESDLIFDSDVIKQLISEPFDNMVAVAKYEQWMDGTVVLLDENKNIVEFVEKSAFRFSEAGQYFKTVNIYKFSRRFLKNQFIIFLEAYVKAYGANQYYELVLKILAHIRYSELKAFVLEDYNWYEIDDEQDLQIAGAIFAEDNKQFNAYDHLYGGFWRFPKLNDFCYLVNPYYPPQKMLEHMRYFYDALLRGYPSGLETQNLNAGRMFNIKSEYMVVGNGAAELIHVLGQLINGKMLVQMPVFNEYVRCFKGCELSKLNSISYNFNIPVCEIFNRIEDVDIVALINPDNPRGSYILYNDLVKILEICHSKNKICIIDESFVDFAERDIRYTLLDDNILEKYPNLIVIKSISKSYGVPGLRLGVMASSDQNCIREMRANMPIWNINSFAEYFLQIHNLYEKDYEKACDQIANQRKVMENKLSSISLLEVFPSQANYIMCRLKGRMDAKELANILVKNYNILIKDLSAKDGIEGLKYIRVAVKSKDENDKLVSAIRAVLY